ncbi:hypothetical protein [Fimbriiglobus ruber]|nr:hypothetical protein [Fimbriiglobus ruber]
MIRANDTFADKIAAILITRPGTNTAMLLDELAGEKVTKLFEALPPEVKKIAADKIRIRGTVAKQRAQLCQS